MPRDNKSSIAFRAASGVFGAGTVVFAALVVYELTAPETRLGHPHEFRTGLLTYGLLTGLTAVGLWMRRSWGRSLALLLTIAFAGLGTITLLSAITTKKESWVVPLIVVVLSVAAAVCLSRPWFATTSEIPVDD